jgi:hypothetical protein
MEQHLQGVYHFFLETRYSTQGPTNPGANDTVQSEAKPCID